MLSKPPSPKGYLGDAGRMTDRNMFRTEILTALGYALWVCAASLQSLVQPVRQARFFRSTVPTLKVQRRVSLHGPKGVLRIVCVFGGCYGFDSMFYGVWVATTSWVALAQSIFFGSCKVMLVFLACTPAKASSSAAVFWRQPAASG